MHTRDIILGRGVPYFFSRNGIALLSVTLAAVFSLVLHRLGYHETLPLFYGAVLASAWLGGLLPALVATALSVSAITFLFQPFVALSGAVPYRSGQVVLFVVVSLVICSLGAVRGRSESARRVSDRHYQLLFDRNLAGVFLSTLDGQVLDCNESFARILGYDSRKEVLAHPATDFYFDSKHRESNIEKLKHGESVTTFEVCLRGKDDRPVWIIENVSLIEDDVGSLTLLQGTIVDITKRKQAEDALSEATRQYRDIFEYAVEGIFRTTPDGRFIAANPALATMLGYQSPADLIQDQSDLARKLYVDPQRREEFKHLMLEHGMVRDFDFEVKRKDGSKIWLADNVRSVLDDNGEILYYEGTSEDVTERKRGEEALRESEERYRELFENALDAIYVHNLSGKYISVNRAAEKLTGFSRAEIIGKNVVEFVSPKYIEEVRERLREKMSSQNQTAYEIEIITKDGHLVHVEVNSRLIYENGIAVGVQGMARDISDRKIAEEALRNLPRRLIGAQEAERRRVARELHDEIGQALTAIRINLQSVQQSAGEGPLASQLDGSLDIIDCALQQTRDLARDLRPSLLDDLGLVAALRWYLDREATRAGLTLELKIDLLGTRLAPVIETACFRIAQEALTNIVRHAQAKCVFVELVLHDADLRLVIRDDGIGFDVDAAQHRFAADASLGLQGMQERALAVGGRIDIESTRESGTEVRVRLPFLPKSSSQEED